jgi:subfamily B ATP-binding cassette protein MsbA
MLKLIRPYLPQVSLSVVFTVIFTVCSGVGIWMISPFLDTLFSAESRFGESSHTLLVPGENILADTAGGSEGMPPTEVGSGSSEGTGEQLPSGNGVQSSLSSLERFRDQIKARLNSLLLRGSKLESLWRICVVFFFIYLLKNIAGYLGAVLMVYVGQRVIKDLRDALFLKFTQLPLSFFHRHRGGELISRATNDVQIANKCVNVSFTNMVRDPFFILMYLAVAIVLSWRLTLMAVVVLPITTLVIVQIGKKLRKYSHRQQEKMANLTSILQETVYGIRVVKAFAMEKFENVKFLRESERLFRDVFKIHRMQRLSSPLSEQLSVLVGLFILWYGGNQVLSSGTLPPDMFILFLVCIFSLVHPIKELSQVNNAIQEGMAAAERVFAVLDSESEIRDSGTGEPLEMVKGEVEFRNVSFGYQPEELVLQDVNLKVEPGEVVALVGASGSGKSTLVDLIPRFYEPQQGQILVDGRDIRQLSLSHLRKAMGIVTQEVILFNDTVRNNIAYGIENLPEEDIVAAAQAANAHDFISQLPEGYETFIGDRGVKLSGGERQRISIARAVLKNPPILIFDEATSALDTESEQLVQEAIDRLVRSRTTIVIAHRLSTIQNVDRIYVLQEGRIVQTGSHTDLLVTEGPYRALYQLQFRH